MFLNEMGPAKELDGRYSTPQVFQACRCRAYSKQTLFYKIKERTKQKNVSTYTLTKMMKILTIGDVEGKFTQFFKKLNSVNSKNGPFEMVLCVG